MIASCVPSLTSADILIESHEGQRPGDADAVLGSFRDELETSGVKIRAADVIAAAGDQLPLSGTSDPTLDRGHTVELSEQVTQGTNQVFRGDYSTGLTTLEGVLAHARENPAVVVADPSSRVWLTKTYAAIAFAQVRSQRVDQATEAVAEQIRSFPDQAIGRIVGPEIAALADAVRKKLETSPHGTLRIIASQPDVQIFVDENARGTGRSFVNAVPGTYRLLVARHGISRRYAVRVLPERGTDVYIDWDADSAFSVTSNWVGFMVPRGQQINTQAAVARYARGSRQHDVLVASIVERSRHRFLVGTIFEKQTGALLRHKAIALGAGDAPCKRALAQYLLTGSAAACVIDLPPDAATQVVRSSSRPTARDRFLGAGIVAGVGAMATIGGATLLMSKEDRPTGPPGYLDWTGVSLLAGGGLAIGVAAYWANRIAGDAASGDVLRRRSRAPIYVAASTAAAAFVAGGYLLHIDGTGSCGNERSSDCPYRYALSGQAWTFIGAGIGALGFGVYWHLRTPRAGQAAIVTLIPTTAGGLASVQGRF